MEAFYTNVDNTYISSESEQSTVQDNKVVLKIHYVRLCGSDLNVYRNLNLMVILGY